jgi:tetratricopeptide (TPR) repeat protein
VTEFDQFNDAAVPVEAEDFARRRRRVRLAIGAASIVIATFALWTYKRQVDPIAALQAFDAGERYFGTARYQQSISSFEHAIALRPDYTDAYLMRGRANAAMNKPLVAIPDFNKCIEMRPTDPVAFLDRGSAHLALHSYEEALADFTSAIQLDPKLDTAYNLRGTTFRAMGKHEKALEDFDRAVELRPLMNNFFQRGATYQLLDRHELAITDFSSAITIEPYGPQAYYARAQSYRALGNLAAADQDHSHAAELDGQ